MYSDIKILIIYNPKAGKGQIKRIMPEVKRLFESAGLIPLFHATKRRDDAYETALKFAKKYYKKSTERNNSVYVIAAGGDGTLNEVMRGILDSGCDVPIGIIPAGSTNDFGYSLGINDGMMKAAEKAVDAILVDDVFKCDAAYMQANDDKNGKYITYTAAFGLFSAVSYATPQKLKNTFGHMAYLMYGAKNIFKTRKIHTEILYKCKDAETIADRRDEACDEADITNISEDFSGRIDADLLLGMIVSAKSVGGFRGITGNGVELDDGEDELLFVRWPQNPIMLLKTLWHALGMVRKNPEAQEKAGDLSIDYGIKKIKVKDAVFRFNKPVSWALDGEDGGEVTQVRINVLKQAVSYLIALR